MQTINWYEVAKESNLLIKNEKQFITNFGIFPWICNFLFTILFECDFIKFKPNHLLMALYFMKCYPYDDQASAIWKITRKSWAKWIWGTITVLYLHFTGKGSLVRTLIRIYQKNLIVFLD